MSLCRGPPRDNGLSSFLTYKTATVVCLRQDKLHLLQRQHEKLRFWFLPKPQEKMLIGSATRYIGGRKAVQTVYWRTVKRNSEKLLKTGKHFNLKKPTVDDNQGMRVRYAGRMTDNQICQQ